MYYCPNVQLLLLVMFPMMLGVAAQPFNKEKYPMLYRWLPLTGWVVSAVLAVVFLKHL